MARLLDAVAVVDLDDDLYQLGLRGTIDPNARPRLAVEILKARQALRGRLAEPAVAALVEPFDRDRYTKNMSVAENLLFGTPVGDRLRLNEIPDNEYVKATLDRAGVTDALLSMGRRIAETMVELFADLPPGHPFFEQFSFIDADDLPEFRALLGRIEKTHMAGLTRDDRAKLIAVSLPYVEARHRLDLVDEVIEAYNSYTP